MKIKYVNYLLCLIAIVGSLFVVFTKDKTVGSVLKDLAILITITLPYIVRKIWKVKLDDKLEFIYILFVFSAHFLGAVIELYNKIDCFDKINHTLSGILTSFGALFLLHIGGKYKPKNKIFNIASMLCFTLAVAACWEIFEYLANICFGGDAQRVALTGVNDTMQDIIVAFIGSSLVCLLYGFYQNLSIFNFRNSVKKID